MARWHGFEPFGNDSFCILSGELVSRNPPPNFGYSTNPNRCQTFYSILSCVNSGVALHYLRIDMRTSNGDGGKPGAYGLTPGVCILEVSCRESLVEILKFSPLSHLQCELDLLHEHSRWTTDITGKLPPPKSPLRSVTSANISRVIMCRHDQKVLAMAGSPLAVPVHSQLESLRLTGAEA